MRSHLMLGSTLAVALVLGTSAFADDLKSGPQVGQGVSAFNPLNVTGSAAGQKVCQV